MFTSLLLESFASGLRAGSHHYRTYADYMYRFSNWLTNVVPLGLIFIDICICGIVLLFFIYLTGTMHRSLAVPELAVS